MATIQHYNHTASLLTPGGGVLPSDVWTVVLLDENATFDATDTTLAEATSSGTWEVYGNGWAQGGEAISNVASSLVDTTDGQITADDLEVQIIGGDLGPFDFYLICVDDIPLSFITLSAAKTVLNGYVAHIPWTDGVLYSSAMA